MSLTISSLYCSPIKSLSFQNIKKATIKKQIGILHDRILAFSRGVDLTKAKQIEQDPTQRELINFMTLKNTPALNKYNFELLQTFFQRRSSSDMSVHIRVRL